MKIHVNKGEVTGVTDINNGASPSVSQDRGTLEAYGLHLHFEGDGEVTLEKKDTCFTLSFNAGTVNMSLDGNVSEAPMYRDGDAAPNPHDTGSASSADVDHDGVSHVCDGGTFDLGDADDTHDGGR